MEEDLEKKAKKIKRDCKKYNTCIDCPFNKIRCKKNIDCCDLLPVIKALKEYKK